MYNKLITNIKPLGFTWETKDPFLFCVHHLDHYPPGNDQLGPAVSLAGRNLGQDFTTTLAGPSFGTANDIAKTFAALRSGDDGAAKTFDLLYRSAPFANLFYIKPVLDYTFGYQVKEALNPGYTKRLERRLKKENNQEFLIKPSSVVN